MFEKHDLQRFVRSNANTQKWLELTSFSISLIAAAVVFAPSVLAQETIVDRKISINGDGSVTQTTTTTTTRETVPTGTIVAPGVSVVSPTVPIVVSSAANVAVDSTLYQRTLDDRQARLRTLVADAVATNSLSAADAARINAELDRLATVKTVTYETFLPAAIEYDLIGSRLNVVDVKPIVQGSKVVLIDSQIIPFDDMAKRRADLSAKISYEQAIGKISDVNALRLRGMLDHVAVLESEYRSDGTITDHEARRLYDEYDRVGQAIDHAM
jgi:hypothetical protein